MKRKEKYDLCDLTISVGYLVDGCGKRVEGERYVQLKKDGIVLLSEVIKDNRIMDRILQWLEGEEC
mgnify:CR=1 FL=1